MSWWDGRLIAFDIESTGVDLEEDRIVTAAISHVGNNLEPENRNWLVNPGVKIAQGAIDVHGITNEKAAAEGEAPERAIEDIISILTAASEQGTPIVIYNARFDMTMLDREARRYNIKPLVDRCDVHVVDPLIIDRAVDQYRKGSRKLVDVCAHYGIKLSEDNAHNAYEDAISAARLAWVLGKRVSELDVDLDELHRRQVIWARKQGLNVKRYFKEIGKTDANVQIEWPLVPFDKS